MFRKLRKSRVEKEEIIADLIFIALSFLITDGALLIFDLHWNFYQAGNLLEKQIFQNKLVYLWGGFLGGIIGLFLIKLFLLGVKEEEIKWSKAKKHKNRQIPINKGLT